jgi:hypothetical protein
LAFSIKKYSFLGYGGALENNAVAFAIDPEH